MLVLWYCSSSFFFFMASCSCCLMIWMWVSRSVSSCTMGLCAKPSRSVFPFDCRGSCLLTWGGEGGGGGRGGTSLHCKHSRLFCCSSSLDRRRGQTEFSQTFQRFCWLFSVLHLFTRKRGESIFKKTEITFKDFTPTTVQMHHRHSFIPRLDQHVTFTV